MAPECTQTLRHFLHWYSTLPKRSGPLTSGYFLAELASYMPMFQFCSHSLPSLIAIYLTGVTIAFFAYDYLLNLAQEVELMWHRHISWPRSFSFCVHICLLWTLYLTLQWQTGRNAVLRFSLSGICRFHGWCLKHLTAIIGDLTRRSSPNSVTVGLICSLWKKAGRILKPVQNTLSMYVLRIERSGTCPQQRKPFTHWLTMGRPDRISYHSPASGTSLTFGRWLTFGRCVSNVPWDLGGTYTFKVLIYSLYSTPIDWTPLVEIASLSVNFPGIPNS